MTTNDQTPETLSTDSVQRNCHKARIALRATSTRKLNPIIEKLKDERGRLWVLLQGETDAGIRRMIQDRVAKVSSAITSLQLATLS